MKKDGISRLKRACIVFLAADIVVACALGAALALYRRAGSDNSQRDALARQMEMSQSDWEEAYAQLLGDAHRAVSLRSEADVQNGRIGIWLSNEEENGSAVEMELVLLASGDVIAQTDLVDPGWHVETVQLDKQLAPGEYQCLARLHFYTMDGSRYIGATAKQVLLRVE